VDGLDADVPYTYSREHGWITVGIAPTDYLEVQYTTSARLDMAITNWDSGLGNYVYYNRLGCIADLDGDGDTDVDDVMIVVEDYGCTADCAGDLDGDGDTDLADLAILVDNYGCPWSSTEQTQPDPNPR